MRIYWWQGGVHIHPETSDERQALVILWEGAKRGRRTVSSSEEGYTGCDGNPSKEQESDLVDVKHDPVRCPRLDRDD
jgi:hypothetical protein